MEPDLRSRNYSAEERDTEEFRRLNAAMGESRGPYRDWEYPAALKAVGDPSGLRLLSVGAFNCSLSVFLSNFAARTIAADRVSAGAVKGWPAGRKWQWAAGTEFLEGDFGETGKILPEASFDIIVSVSAVEHNKDDGDKAVMHQIGRLLAPGGIAAVTMEWATEPAWDPDFVEGRIYDVQAILERLVAPSGLRMGRFETRPICWSRCLADFPDLAQAKALHCPALLALRHNDRANRKKAAAADE